MLLVRTKYQKPTPKEFFTWLDKTLEEKGWSERKVSDLADISHSVISKARSGIQPIGYDACRALAVPLSVTDEFIFRIAGLLPKPSEWSQDADELAAIARGLNGDDIDELKVLARSKAEKYEKRGNPKKQKDR